MLGYKMKIFIDSADINEIKSLNDTGLIDGVTTLFDSKIRIKFYRCN